MPWCVICCLGWLQLSLQGSRGLLELVEDGARLGVHHGVGGDGAAGAGGHLVLPHHLDTGGKGHSKCDQRSPCSTEKCIEVPKRSKITYKV